MDDICFGTDGWRGIMAKDFTFFNVGRVAQAVAHYLKSPGRGELGLYKNKKVDFRPWERGVVIGYDTRFLSKEFALYFGKVIKSNDIPTYISQEPVPTPALSFAVTERKFSLGVMITASHNPPQYNGIKIKMESGGAAPKEVTDQIEKMLKEIKEVNIKEKEKIETIDLKTPYLKRIKELIDPISLKESSLYAVVDSMYGSASWYVSHILKEVGVEFVQVRGSIDPLFGGKSPEPIKKNLVPLKAVIRSRHNEMAVGVATDGDGDRVVGMDEQGNLIDPHRCYALIFRHLLKKSWRGLAVKTFSLSDMATKIAKANDVKIKEVPIGFKYISELFLSEDVLIGGEESGGIGIKNHIPERDGILMSLLLLEIAAFHKKPISQIIEEMMEEVGSHYYDRCDIHLKKRFEVVERIKEKPPESLAGREVIKVENLDGVKLRFEDGWVMLRASGTEPLLRLYCEMDKPEKVNDVLGEVEGHVKGELKLW
jgi:phosphomannomutase